MHISINYAIFWLPSGKSFEQSSGTDSSYISLIDRFLNDTSGTSYYNILNQYPDDISGTPLDKSILGGSYLDTTPYPVAGTTANPLHDSDIQTEVTNAMKANNWVPGPNKIFHVFTGYGIQSCFDPPNNNICTFDAYCAYHSFFAKGSQSTIYSNMPDVHSLSISCTPPGLSPPNHDSFADPEINVLSHELFEAVSDPLLNAWTDIYGNEIGDKCAWNFGNNVNPDGSNLVINGHKYLVQLEWSNYNGCVLSYGPSHPVTIGPSPGSTLFPSTVTFNITYASEGSIWWTTTSYSNGTLAIDIDQNTQISITGNTSAASQPERWCFDQTCSDTSFSSGNGPATAYYYYDLLEQQVSVSTAAQLLSASLNYATGPIQPSTLGLPQQLTAQVNQTTWTIWIQRGTIASVDSPISIGVNSRWVTRISAWTISAAMEIPDPIVYYPQYLTTFQYTVSGGGSYSPPYVTYYDTGVPKTILADTPVWADPATYDYQSQLPGSTPYERWSTPTPDGLVSAPGGSISTNYYHQYGVTVSYQFTGGNAPTTPSLTGDLYGLSVPISLTLQPSIIWLDAGSAYGLTNMLPGGSNQERWYAAISNSGLVSSPMILSPTYSHQYFLTVSGALPGSTGEGWYDAGSSAVVTSPSANEISSTSRTLLTAYSEDGGSPISLPDPSLSPVSISFGMNSPHTLQFSSKLQYYLATVLQPKSMRSITLSPTGDSWYDSGTSVYIVLNRNWDAIGNTRQSLMSYSIDNTATSIDRRSSSPVDIPAIIMTTSHLLSEQPIIQYYIWVEGATLSGSQTGDGWFDSGSQFIVQGTYSRGYTVYMSYHVYAVPVGFQILANTTVSSVLWTSSSGTLSFSAYHADVTVYIPKELNLTPSEVSDDGTALVFSYSPSNDLLSFKGSSSFQVNLASASGASVQPIVPDWVLYPAAIAIAVGVVLILGLVLMKRQARKSSP